MHYAVEIKFCDRFTGEVLEKALPTNNTRCGNYLFDTHKSYTETLAVKLVDRDGNTLRQWVRT